MGVATVYMFLGEGRVNSQHHNYAISLDRHLYSQASQKSQKLIYTCIIFVSRSPKPQLVNFLTLFLEPLIYITFIPHRYILVVVSKGQCYHQYSKNVPGLYLMLTVFQSMFIVFMLQVGKLRLSHLFQVTQFPSNLAPESILSTVMIYCICIGAVQQKQSIPHMRFKNFQHTQYKNR